MSDATRANTNAVPTPGQPRTRPDYCREVPLDQDRKGGSQRLGSPGGLENPVDGRGRAEEDHRIRHPERSGKHKIPRISNF